MKKIILKTITFALFTMSVYGANYNATLSEGTYTWTDEIWDIAPNANGTISVTGVGADKSVLNYSGTQTTQNKLLVTDATVNIQGTVETPATYNFGAGEIPPTLEVVDGIFNSSNATLTFGNFLIVKAHGDSEINFNSGTVFDCDFININLADSSVLTLDGTTWNKSMWAGTNNMNQYTDSSKLVLKNASTLNYRGYWGDVNEVLFDKNASIDISGGSSFIGQNGVKLVMSNNAVATVDGTNSALNFSAMQLNNSAKINVKDGGTVNLTDVEINDNASINFLSDFTYSSATIKATGTSAIINIDGVTMTRGNNDIIVGGNTVLNFKNGATFSLRDGHGLTIADSAKVVFDNSYIEYATFPVVTATGGELVFKNNSGISPTASHNFGRYDFSGNAKMTIDSSTLSSNFHSQSGYVFDFSNTAELNIQNGGSLIYGDVYNYAIRLQNSAKLNISGGSTMNFTGNVDRKIEILGLSSVNIGSGVNNVSLGPVIMEKDASFNISGSQNTITFMSLESAGTFKFISDEIGISKITTSEIIDMSGMLILDFSRFLGEELNTAIITTADIFTFDEYIGTNESDLEKVNVITRNEGDAWDIYFEDGTLMIAYTAVPEPSTYAAILGIAALGLAICKRRRM